jgi:dienelactone hydrolase
MIISRLLPVFLISISAANAVAAEMHTASNHPMEYYLSLPKGWYAGKSWPVVVVIESANRQFESAAEHSAAARGDMPFIVATPLVVTNGGARYREVPSYRYSDDVWARIERDGTCRFDFEGIAAVAADLHAQFGGEEKCFITGFEAGGHTVWAYLFHSPESLRAVAPVSPNFAGRCIGADNSSSAAVRAVLPVRVFSGALGGSGNSGSLLGQSQRAIQTAEERGFHNVSQTTVPAKGHEPLAEEVFAYFLSVWKQTKAAATEQPKSRHIPRPN